MSNDVGRLGPIGAVQSAINGKLWFRIATLMRVAYINWNRDGIIVWVEPAGNKLPNSYSALYGDGQQINTPSLSRRAV